MSEPEQLDLLDWLAAQPPSPTPAMLEPAPSLAILDPGGPYHLIRVDPSCNMRRFYSLALAQNLWGEWGVMRRWGRVGAQGRVRTDWVGDREQAVVERDRLEARKRRRGYR